MTPPSRPTTIPGDRPGRFRARESGRARANRVLLGLERLEDRSLAAAAITEISLPSGGSRPQAIATGPDGALWVTESAKSRIARVTTSGAISEFPTPTSNSGLWELVSASDGALWFTENSANKVGRITTSGAVTEYTIPTAGSRPQGIAAGPDGALWFAENSGKKIGRITTSGAITEYSLAATNGQPQAIAAGPDGALWFTDSQNSRVGRITTSGNITQFAVPGTGHAFGAITSGPDGALWFTDAGKNLIYRMTTSGVLTSFVVPTSGSNPAGIATGPDGALWFTESSDPANRIGRLTTAGVFTETAIPTHNGMPVDITLGPDGALWFVENKSGKVGRISATPGPTYITVDTTSDVVDGVTTSVAALLAGRGLDGHISLREAILAANLTPGPDEIRFAIPDSVPNHFYYRDDAVPGALGTPVRTTLDDASIADFDPDYPYAAHSWFRIDLDPALPELRITDPLTIDGDSQPGASPNTLGVGDDASIRIELTCTAVGGNSQLSTNCGLVVASGGAGSLIQGLAVNRFGGAGILIDRLADGTAVEGNFLGTDVTGTVALGNGDDGIQVQASNTAVGGSTPASRNVISGNLNRGLGFFTGAANLVQNNYIGVDATGTRPLGNQGDGVVIDGGAGDDLIGGTAPDLGNVIAYNGGIGVNVSSGTGSAILGNTIFGNVGLGIDLRGDGVTPNAGNRPPGQPNLRMNFPVIVTVTPNGTNLDVSGYVGSAPNQSAFGGARVEFFATDNDPRNHGQATAYLGFLIADAGGNFSGSIPSGGLDIGDPITATATDGANNTSEFATNTPIGRAAAGVTVSASNGTSVYGQSLSLTVSVSGASGTPTGTVTFVEGTTVLGTVTLTGGVAVFSTSTLPAGVHGVVAQYSGDPRYLPSNSLPTTLTVTPAPLTVVADSLTKTYGAAVPTLTYTYSGLVNGDTAAVLRGGLSTAATAGSHVGVYGISQGTLSAGPNYAIVYGPGILTVVAAPLVVAADDAARAYGEPNPAFSAHYIGLANGDTPASLGGTLAFSTPATPTSPVGSYPIVPGGLTSSDYAITFADGTLNVGLISIAARGRRFVAVEGSAFSRTVATFTVSDPGAAAGDFSAAIDWGDGATSAGTIGYNAARGEFTVTGAHAYAREGVYQVGVAILGPGGSTASANGTAVVSDAPLSATGRTFVAVEGSAFATVVATFADANPNALAGDFSATIDWGDGHSSPGLVERDPAGGGFNVIGAGTYAASGLYPVRVTIRDVGGSAATARSLAIVSDAVPHPSLAARGAAIAATEGVGFSGPVGSFVDGGTRADAGAYTVTIDWGDGTTSAGSVVDGRRAGYLVDGTHTYAAAGPYTVLITVVGIGGELATAVSPAVVSLADGAGPPVIVDPGPAVPPVELPGAGSPTPTPVTPTAIAAPFVPAPPAFFAPSIVPGPAAPPILPATAALGPRGLRTPVGQSVDPAPASPGRSGDGPGAGVVAASGAAAPRGPNADNVPLAIVRPLQGGAAAVDQMVSGLVRAWLAAVQAAGDEAGAVVAALERVPAAGTPLSLLNARGERDFPRELLWGELDDLGRDVATGTVGEAAQQVFGVTLVAYVGYVLLNSRSGLWLLSLLMARPLWKQFDPLEVLLAWEQETQSSGARDEDDETLQSMVGDDHETLEQSKGRDHVANQPRARQPHGESPARRPRAGAAAGSRPRGARRAKSAL